MLKIKTIITGVAIFMLILSSCSKENVLLDSDDSGMKYSEEIYVKESSHENSAFYIYNGKYITKDMIDFENNDVSIVYFGNSIYVFYSEKEMYNWALSKKELSSFAKSIKDTELARNYAVETGSINEMKPTEEYLRRLNDNFSGAEMKGGSMYDQYNLVDYLTLLYPVPVPSLKSEYDNKLSSFYQLVNSYRFFDKTYFRGDNVNYIGLVQPLGTERNIPLWFNNRASSYWAY